MHGADMLPRVAKYNITEFSRDATAVLLSWIMADKALKKIAAAGTAVPNKLKQWKTDMSTYSFNFDDHDVGEKVCAQYVAPKEWAVECNSIYESLKLTEQVGDTVRYKVDAALVKFLVSRFVLGKHILGMYFVASE